MFRLIKEQFSRKTASILSFVFSGNSSNTNVTGKRAGEKIAASKLDVGSAKKPEATDFEARVNDLSR